MNRRGAWVALFSVTMLMIAGCGKPAEPSRYRVSGTANYDGVPIVFGDVLITPNGAKKNSGAQAIANIREGKYDTTAEGGKGYGGGPAIIRVTGFDKQGGKLICEYEYEADLPAADATLEIKVPKGAKIKPASPEI